MNMSEELKKAAEISFYSNVDWEWWDHRISGLSFRVLHDDFRTEEENWNWEEEDDKESTVYFLLLCSEALNDD